MKQFHSRLLFSALLLATSTAFSSCQNDDDDITIISPLAGDYLGHETCPPTGTPGTDEYSVTVYNQADANNGKVFITNIYGIGGVYEGTVSGNTITVASTPYAYTQGSTTYRGNLSATGTIDGSVLTLNFELDGPLADECKFVGDKNARHAE